jgi:alkylhydroperoxidase family enzyme
MALLSTIPPEKAEGKLKELYGVTEMMFGGVPNNVRMLGVSPKILENMLGIVEYYAEHPTLRPPFQAMVRMMVSKQCNSPFCENLNTGMLLKGGMTVEQIEACKADPENAPLDEKEKTLLKFVLKATKDPHSVAAQDVEALKSLGWSDRDIFDAVAQGARLVGNNILFDAFKIDLG